MKILNQIIVIVIIPLFIIDCSRTNQTNEEGIKSKTKIFQIDTLKPKISPTFINQRKLTSLDHIKNTKQFVENFVPGGPGPVDVPDSVVRSFKALRSDKVNQEKYLTLLYLKIYHGHLECCHQSYELRKNSQRGIDSISDPLLYEFNLITKYYDYKKHIEFISSSIAFEWLQKHKYLLKYDRIKKEYYFIREIHQNIEKGVYWK